MSKDTAMAQFLTFLGKHLPGLSPQDLDRMQKAAIGHPTALPDPIIARVRVPCIDVPCVSFHSLFDMAFVGTVSRPEIASDPKTYGFFEHLKMYNRAGHVIWNDAHVLAFCRPNGSDGLAYAIIGCNNWISLKWGEFSGIVMDRQPNTNQNETFKAGAKNQTLLCQFHKSKNRKQFAWFNRATGCGGTSILSENEEDGAKTIHLDWSKGLPLMNMMRGWIDRHDADIVEGHVWMRERRDDEEKPWRLRVDNWVSPWFGWVQIAKSSVDGSNGSIRFLAREKMKTAIDDEGTFFLGTVFSDRLDQVAKDRTMTFCQEYGGRFFFIHTTPGYSVTTLMDAETGWRVRMPTGIEHLSIFPLGSQRLAIVHAHYSQTKIERPWEIFFCRIGEETEMRPERYEASVQGVYNRIENARLIGKRVVLYVITPRGEGILIHGRPHNEVIPLFGPFERLTAVKTGNPEKPDEEVILSWQFGDGVLSILQYGEPA